MEVQRKQEKQVERELALPGWLMVYFHINNAQPLICVCEKELTVTDVNKHHNRLAIPRRYINDGVLPSMTREEEVLMRESGQGLPVMALDQMGRRWELRFKFWSTSNTYVLIGDWNRLVETNRLMALDTLRLWVFRYRYNESSKLCFVIGDDTR